LVVTLSDTFFSRRGQRFKTKEERPAFSPISFRVLVLFIFLRTFTSIVDKMAKKMQGLGTRRGFLFLAAGNGEQR